MLAENGVEINKKTKNNTHQLQLLLVVDEFVNRVDIVFLSYYMTQADIAS